MEINFGIANEKQRAFFASRTLYTCYGGARGGGKSWAIRTKAAGGALAWPGIRILIIRRTYPELQQNHIEPMQKLIPPSVAAYNATLRTLSFKNGSTIRFGHAQSATGAETEYQGQEYDWIFLDEATQFSESEFRTLGGCLRGVNEIPKRFYLTCNPGGVGHSWVKRLFIDRDFITDPNDPERSEDPDDYSFIFASVDDNDALLKSPGGEAYRRMLSALPEKLRAAHRYGDWNALSGAYFDEFRDDRHLCEPFAIPKDWPRWRAFDYGLDRFVCLWAAVSPDGVCYVYRELCRSGLIVSEAARAMLEQTMPGEEICATFAPPDLWSRQKDTGRSMAELFQIAGIGLIRADNSRVQGHLMIKELLAERQSGGAGLRFFPGCRETVRCLRAIQADELNPSDCAKEPHSLTHAVDALRYFCAGYREAEAAPPEEDPDAFELRAIPYADFMTGGEAFLGYLQ